MSETHRVFLVRCWGGDYRGRPANVDPQTWLVCGTDPHETIQMVEKALGYQGRPGDIAYQLDVGAEHPLPDGVTPEAMEAMLRKLQPLDTNRTWNWWDRF